MNNDIKKLLEEIKRLSTEWIMKPDATGEYRTPPELSDRIAGHLSAIESELEGKILVEKNSHALVDIAQLRTGMTRKNAFRFIEELLKQAEDGHEQLQGKS